MIEGHPPQTIKGGNIMASNYTNNYSLCQWEASDKVLRTEFNADNAKIDAAIAAVDSRVDGKASTSALNSLKTTVNGKASQSALDSLSATVSGQGPALAKRNCAVHLETYIGSGISSRTFTYSGKPWLVIFFRKDGVATVAVRGSTKGYLIGSSDLCSLTFSWSGNSLDVYNAASYINYENQTYTSIAFLEP